MLGLMILFSSVACNTDSSAPESETDVEEKKAPESDDTVYGDSEGSYLEKVGSVSTTASLEKAKSGLIYKSGDKYGILTHDGKHDTGAKYYSCKAENGDEYFVVSTFDLKNVTEDNLDDVNSSGVVDAYGKTILPNEYAVLNVLNERYIEAIKVTKLAESEDDYLVYFYADRFPHLLGARDGDILFEGEWYIYDVEKGKMIDGLTGTEPENIYAYGNYLKLGYNTYDCEGNVVSDLNFIDAAGRYYTKNDDEVNVYDINDNLLFKVKADDGKQYSVRDYFDGYFVVSSNESGKNYEFVLVDEHGDEVSAIFNSGINKVFGGKYIKTSDNVLYDFEGNKISDAKIVYEDELFGRGVYVEKADGTVCIIDYDGNVIYEKNSSDVTVSSDFIAEKKVDGENMRYNFADEEFNIKGSRVAPWLVYSVDESNNYSLIDTFTGKAILEGYKSYSYSSFSKLIYAKTNSGYDIYKINAQ